MHLVTKLERCKSTKVQKYIQEYKGTKIRKYKRLLHVLSRPAGGIFACAYNAKKGAALWAEEREDGGK